MTYIIISAPDDAPSFPVEYWDGTSTTCTPYYAERTTDLDGSTRVIVYGRMRDDEPDPDYPNGYDGKADFKAADDAPEWARDLFADVIR
jgi:hypothetical protein